MQEVTGLPSISIVQAPHTSSRQPLSHTGGLVCRPSVVTGRAERGIVKVGDEVEIVGMRDTLRNLAAAGKTVFVSSHLMSEMAQTADHLIVIGQGRLLADSTVTELTAGGRSLEEAFLALTSDSAAYRGVAPAQPRRQ